MYIDIKTGINTSNDPSYRVALNAEKADKLNNVNTTENIPVYFKNGLPVEITKNYLELDSANKALIEDIYFTNIHGNLNGNATSANKLNFTGNVGAVNVPVYFQDGVPVPCNELKTGEFLPLTAGEEHKISGPLGFTEASYGSMLPETGFEGQLFFLEDDNSSTLPSGGSAGQALVKNSTADGDASWKDIVALPKGGSAGQVLIKNSTTDGDASWSTRLNAINHLGAVGVYSRSDIGYSPNFDDPGVNGLFEVRGNNETPGESGIKPYNTFLPM